MAMAMAFKKRQQGFQLASSPILKMAHHFNNLTSLQWKARARMTLILNMAIHGRSEEECLEITVNEHGQPIGPDDATCNEFISFLGTIARKAHILPLTERCKKNKANRQVGKEKNFMHTSGPRSFARVRYKWKKDRKTTQDPSPIQMLIAPRKEKLTKRKPGDLRDKLISELQELDSEKDVDTVILNIIGSDNKKKCRLNLHGRGKVEEKHAKEVEAIQKDYEDKRQQDRRYIANGLRSFFSQFQKQNPHMSFDLSMFGSLLLDGQPETDTNPVGLLQLHSSSSTSKEMNNNVEGEEEEEDDDDNN
ncbi:Opaque-specific ABC transporter CDR3 [Bienertia sinuspersici]